MCIFYINAVNITNLSQHILRIKQVMISNQLF